jgi:lipid II:glycine glycyltransferase (peptidoglycan interpeptide bridge formation enzyme)
MVMLPRGPNVSFPFESLLGRLDTGAARASARPDSLRIRPIDAARHASFVEAQSASFLQTPEWAAVKRDWRSERLGWFDGDRLLGVALVLHRPVPGTHYTLAYVPEGPVLPWAEIGDDVDRWLRPFAQHLKGQHAFAVRLGPALPVRSWDAATAKRGLADPAMTHFGQLAPDEVTPGGRALIKKLRALGWHSVDADTPIGSFSNGQPRIGVRIDLRDRTVADLLAGANQQWRRNIKSSTKAGVSVRIGTADDLAVFHHLYLETAERDGFQPRPRSYFEGMWKALDPRIRVYVAELGDEPLAAALMIRVGGYVWYSYGASTSRHREAQASTAMQWRAILDAQAEGAHTYDLRGITDTLDPQNSHAGLLRFKLSTGGTVVETAGEWELTLLPLVHQAFKLYLKVRS